MTREGSYKTKQRDGILSFFENHQDKQFSAQDLIDNMEISVGKATVYRSLAMLTEEGKLNRFIPAPGSAALYEYNSGDSSIQRCRMSCIKCGGTAEMCCSFISEFERHLEGDHNFLVDTGKTVIYGLCESCHRLT